MCETYICSKPFWTGRKEQLAFEDVGAAIGRPYSASDGEEREQGLVCILDYSSPRTKQKTPTA